jgi:hypothetical protein
MHRELGQPIQSHTVQLSLSVPVTPVSSYFPNPFDVDSIANVLPFENGKAQLDFHSQILTFDPMNDKEWEALLSGTSSEVKGGAKTPFYSPTFENLPLGPEIWNGVEAGTRAPTTAGSLGLFPLEAPSAIEYSTEKTQVLIFALPTKAQSGTHGKFQRCLVH